MPSRPSRALALPCGLALALLAGCGTSAPPAASAPRSPAPSVPASPASPAPPAPRARTTTAPDQVAPLAARRTPDVLVRATRTMSGGALARLRALSPPGGSVVFRAGLVRVAGAPLHAVAVDPSAFRVFAAAGTAEADGVWGAVGRGEAVASHAVRASRALTLGAGVRVAPTTGPEQVARLGALATTGVPGTDLVVDDALGARLGLAARTGLLLTVSPGGDPVDLAARVRAITGTGAAVDLLTAPAANPVAFLTGGGSAKAFGAFSYRYFSDGTIQPDAAWVRANIRTESVPVLGRVTCHRLMLPQLRGALQEVVDRGLAGSLHSYDGCYVPRFIERNPKGSISLHTWGIAIDLDAATNYRGIRGTMDPAVVAVFKRWGFRWGGDWTYTDPMHFELGALLTTPAR